MTTDTKAAHNTARHVFDHAPLGALIRFSDGTPRPPDRFRRKLQAWEHTNATGTLTAKRTGSDNLPSTFTLLIGEITSKAGVTLATFYRSYSVVNDLTFSIERVPKAGQVLILSSPADNPALLHLANDQDEADAWLRQHNYSDACCETVPDAA